MDLQGMAAVLSAHYPMQGAEGTLCAGCDLTVPWSPAHQAQMLQQAQQVQSPAGAMDPREVLRSVLGPEGMGNRMALWSEQEREAYEQADSFSSGSEAAWLVRLGTAVQALKQAGLLHGESDSVAGETI